MRDDTSRTRRGGTPSTPQTGGFSWNSFPVANTSAPTDTPAPTTLNSRKASADQHHLTDYTAGQGWHDGRIVPYGPLSLEHSAMVFHYAQ